MKFMKIRPGFYQIFYKKYLIIIHITYMFKCNYLDKLKDKTFQKLMISDQKHKCEKGAKFGTNGFADKRVEI